MRKKDRYRYVWVLQCIWVVCDGSKIILFILLRP
jgi:hypothetical protein